jgi:predicted CoA-binding protein
MRMMCKSIITGRTANVPDNKNQAAGRVNDGGTLHLIEEFLAIRRFAMMGVSRNAQDFSRRLFGEFLDRGYEVVPVNPLTKEIGNHECVEHVRDIHPAVSSALLMTPPASLQDIVRECANAGICLVWIYGMKGEKGYRRTIERARSEFGMKVIAGYCPYMFLPSASLVHRFHGAVLKFAGRYPS